MSDISIPKRDSLFLAWAQSFASGVASSPGTYAISPSDAQCIVEAVGEFQQAYSIASNKLTRTAGKVEASRTKRVLTENLLRQYAAQFRANNGISYEALIAVGIKPRKLNPSRRPCPMTSPVVSLMGATPGMFTMHYGDSISPSSGQKPFGATRLELFAMLVDVMGGETMPTMPILPENSWGVWGDDRRNWAWYVGSYSRNPMSVKMPEPDKPMLAVYWGRWANERGEHGPWSLALPTMHVGKCRSQPASAIDPKPVNSQRTDRVPSSDASEEQPLKIAA